MEEYKLIETLEEMFPQMRDLKFDGSGSIRLVGREVEKIGVCVDVTPHVNIEVARHGLDYLIVHQSNGFDERLLSSARNIGAYGLHLSLDTTPGGLIDTFAGIFKFQSTVPIALDYLGHKVENGASLGIFKQPMEMDYIRDALSEACLQIQDAVNTTAKPVRRMVVSTGPAIRTEFLGQMKNYYADTMIAGSIRSGSDHFAKARQMQLLAVGDYKSHEPGLAAFATRLDEVVRQYGAKAMLIPNFES